MRSEQEILQAANDLAGKFFNFLGKVAPQGYKFYNEEEDNPEIAEVWGLVKIAYEHIAETDIENAVAACDEA